MLEAHKFAVTLTQWIRETKKMCGMKLANKCASHYLEQAFIP